jgi:hypothetical protein
MIATTSVPAIWALSGLAISMAIILAYMLVVFVMLYIAFFGVVYFAKSVVKLLHFYD